MELDDLINLSEIFVDAPDDEALTKVVESKGYKKELAERFVAFLPIAFGRIVIAQIADVSFTLNYKVKETSNEYSLTNEPIYNLAHDLAVESYEKGRITREVYSAIALRSAELVAVNKALNAGEDINGANFSTIVLFGYKTLGKSNNWFRSIFS
jgi:hypothetical protein